jgi:NAD+ diphosphatase
MIQDIYPHIFSNAFKPRVPRSGDRVLIYGGDTVFLRGDGELPPFEQLCADAPGRAVELTYLFCVDDTAFFYAESAGLTEEEKKLYVSISAGSFRSHAVKWMAFAGITACHLAGWYERHKLCGRCGAATRHSEKERMIECPGCGMVYYPRISPAVIVGVTDGSRLLLTRYANRPGVNYALIAGFCEIGETVEETVRREVMEEVGLKVKNLRFYKSQPWAFSGSLLMGFYCDLDGSGEVTLDMEELSAAEWFERADIAIADSSVSLTGEMIETFRKGE